LLKPLLYTAAFAAFVHVAFGSVHQLADAARKAKESEFWLATAHDIAR